MKNTIASVLKEAAKIEKKADKVAFLQAKANQPAIKMILKYALDKNVEWMLPEGAPPYKQSQFDEPGLLYGEVRRMYLFLKDGNPNLKQVKREQLFIELLEMVNPDEAELLILAKDKKLYPGLTAAVVKSAFPDLLS